MPRPIKNGLAYFPFDVDFFSDKKIKRLRAKFGTDGITVYMYLLCEIYRNGYYIEYDEDLILDISDELNISEGSTTQIMKYLLSRSLLTEISTLAKSVTILTAVSIQRRYQEAKKGGKRDVVVERDYWLLPKNETNSFIKLYHDENNSENNPNNSENNFDNSEIYSQSKVKKSKVKESKVNVCPGGTYGQHGHVNLTKQEYDDLCKLYLVATVNEYIERVDSYLHKNPNIKAHASHYQTILDWLEKDGADKKSNHSYDLDLLIKHAMETTPKIG